MNGVAKKFAGIVLLFGLAGCNGVQVIPTVYDGESGIYHYDNQVRTGMTKSQLIDTLGEPRSKHLAVSDQQVRHQFETLFGNTGYLDLPDDDEYDYFYYEASATEHRTNLAQNITITHYKQCIYAFNSNDALIAFNCRTSD